MRRMITRILVCGFVLSLLLGMCAHSEGVAGSGRVVRVGCVDIDNFLVVMPDGDALGYGAEYLNELARYTGWRYEFVRGSWAECLGWLLDGTIDLLLPAEYSDERAEQYAFSDQMCCMDYAALVGRKHDDTLYYDDYSELEGKKVGVIKDNYLNSLFEGFAEEHGFSYQTVVYPSSQALNDGLKNGEVAAIVSGNMNFEDNQKLLAKIEYMPAYFITRRQSDGLMDELNDAQHQITLENPYYAADLHEEYYGNMGRQAVGFTREEAEYARNCAPIQLYYRVNNYPLEYRDSDGKATGILVDAAQAALEQCGLKYEMLPWPDGTDFVALAQADGIQALICCEPLVTGQGGKLLYTQSLISLNYDFVGRMGEIISSEKPLRVAIAEKLENGGKLRILQRQKPNWIIVNYPTMEECLNSVRNGETDITFINSLHWEICGSESRYHNLVTANADAISVGLCIGVDGAADPIVRSLLDKGIKKIEKSNLEGFVYHYILSQKQVVTLKDIISDHPVLSIAIVLAFSLSSMLIGIMIVRNRMSRRQALVFSAKNAELEQAIEAQHRLQQESEMDSLTELKNRKALRSLCERELGRMDDIPHAMVMIDIDHFKNINDTRGHLAGDKVLKDFAQYLRRSFGESLMGRVGGDEFLLLISAPGGTEEVAKRLDNFFQKLRDSEELEGMTCSMGVALLRQSGADDYTQMYSRADEALYRAKKAGRDGYVLDV